MKMEANELKKGYIIIYRDSFFKVVDTEHVKPGKGGAFMQVTLQGIERKQKVNERFRVEERLERVAIEEEESILLSKSANQYTFLNLVQQDEVVLSDNLVPFGMFLNENDTVKLVYADTTCIGILMPKEIVCVVKEAPAYIKGQTAAATDKTVILENGYAIKAPQYIENNEKIIIKIDEEPVFVSRFHPNSF